MHPTLVQLGPRGTAGLPKIHEDPARASARLKSFHGMENAGACQVPSNHNLLHPCDLVKLYYRHARLCIVTSSAMAGAC